MIEDIYLTQMIIFNHIKQINLEKISALNIFWQVWYNWDEWVSGHVIVYIITVCVLSYLGVPDVELFEYTVYQMVSIVNTYLLKNLNILYTG